MEYYKFNNSQSEKNPMFIYVKCGDYKIVDVAGRVWHSLPHSWKDGAYGLDRRYVFDITESDYLKAKESYENSEPTVGDEVVVLEYVSIPKRYSIIESIYTSKIGGNVRAILKNGLDLFLTDVRKKEFIHKI